MILSCHYCLLTWYQRIARGFNIRRSLVPYPIAELDDQGRLKSLSFNSEQPQETPGMVFVSGIMMALLPGESYDELPEDSLRGVPREVKERGNFLYRTRGYQLADVWDDCRVYPVSLTDYQICTLRKDENGSYGLKLATDRYVVVAQGFNLSSFRGTLTFLNPLTLVH